jgi:hypothetical protein
MRIRTWVCWVATSALGLAGCGPGNGLTLGRVYGVVTYKGQPVEMGDILFLPNTEKGNTGMPSMGSINKDGSYFMTTQDSGDGVIVGHHKVGIRALDSIPVGKEESPEPDPNVATGTVSMPDRIKMKKAQSLSLRKNRAKADAATVNLRGTIYRFLTAETMANPQTSGIGVQISRGSNRVNFAIAEDGSVKVTP